MADRVALSSMSAEEKRILLARLLNRTEAAPHVAPLSLPQERLWFLDQLDPGAATYNIPTSIPFGGQLKLAALEQALQEIVRRHEVLRTTFARQGHEPVQLIWPPPVVNLDVLDLRSRPRSQRAQEAQRVAIEEAKRPFDLTRGPLLRTVLVRVSETESILLVTMHHIISDGWSMMVFTDELRTLYEAFAADRPSPLPPLTIQYRDFALRQREELNEEVIEQHLEYWRRRLAGAPELLTLPTDHRRPAQRSSRGFVQPFTVPDKVVARLRALSKEEGATLFMTLLAAFKVFLHRHTGHTDLVVGGPVANRSRPDLDPLIGFFVNTLILRTDASGDPSFRSYLRHVRESALEAYPHQELPFEKIVEDIQPQRDLSRNPIFQVAFTFQNVGSSDPNASAVLPDDLPPTESSTAKFDITLGMGETDRGGLAGGLEGSADLFEMSTVTKLAERFLVLLESIAAEADRPISRLAVMREEERKRLLVDWNRTEADFPDACFHEMFERQVDTTPDAVAAEFRHRRLTYRELDRRANQLARYLRRVGTPVEGRVAICFERGLDMAVAVLGTMKAGAAYLPLDPRAPRDRTRFMLEDAAVAAVLTQGDLLERFEGFERQVIVLDVDEPPIACESTARLQVPLDPQTLACVIYTSGSTGVPKGILVPHRGLSNMGTAEVRDFRTNPRDRILQVAPLIFDVSIWEMAMTWFAGATLVFATEEEIVSGAVLNDARITKAAFTPSLLATLDGSRYPNVGTVITVGEACTERVVEAWAPGRRLINAYGPTETTGHCSTADLADDGSAITIGRPIQNVRLYILSEALELVPTGVAGELHVSSPGTTRGYVNRPDLTADRYVPDPFGPEPGGRLYKTGDVVRHLPDGRIEYLGRTDHQVKVRGFRIELGEIEASIAAADGVAEVIAVAREDRPGDKRLIAYVVAERGVTLDVENLRRELRQALPAYMVPAHIVLLDELPLNANRKVDRDALPAPEHGADEAEDASSEMTDTEAVLARIWTSVLGTAPGRHDNFFELGGHSLLATQVLARLFDALHVEIPMRALFVGPTVAELARVVDEALAGGARPDTASIGRISRTNHALEDEGLSVDRVNEQAASGEPFPSSVHAG